MSKGPPDNVGRTVLLAFGPRYFSSFWGILYAASGLSLCLLRGRGPAIHHKGVHT